MKFFEFGKENRELMVLLHGGGVCYRAALPTAKVLSRKYHVVLVAYDGFNPDEPATEFKSVVDEAERLGDYIVKNYGGKIDVLYGVSFGCRVMREVLSDKRLTITTTIADGMETYDYPDIKSEWGKNICCFFMTGLVYWLFGKAGPKRKKLIAKAMGRNLEEIDRILYRDATWKSWKNQDYSCFGRHFNFDDFKRTDMYIWHGIRSVTLPQNSFTALVGPSGGGKSTIAKLIARFWDVNEGAISIGGNNIKDIPPEQLSEMISYVAQDNFLFNCSVLENIRLGNPKATDEQVYAAAKAAMCDEFIGKLKNGYNSSAGEAGGKLSGGERQRIAIARAILKNAPIVILDEATAFTDPENEAQLQQSINSLTKGKTLLVIAHRLSTIKSADNIILLENGKISAQGTQSELLQSSELYLKMWNAHIGAKSWAANNSEVSANV